MLRDRKVTVIGAGIGGLAAALVLARRGARVRVLEQAPAIREVGAGLQISPNGVAVLRALGLARGLAERSVAARQILLHDDRGRPLQTLPLSALRSDLPWLLVHRADLIADLAGAARAAGVEIRLGCRVGALRRDGESVSLNLAGGMAAEAPLVVGADGVRSIVRATIGPHDAPRFTGQTAWRAITPLPAPAEPVVRVYLGAGRHLVAYPLRDRRQMNLVAVQERDDWAGEGWSQKADPQELRTAFAGFPYEVQAWLDHVEQVHLWGLFRHPVAPRWHDGPLAILGDAAHPTLPFLAQGACMALEDAWVLGDCLDAAETPAAALARYQTLRRDRCVRIVAGADRNAWAFHLRAGPVRLLAHAALRAGRQFAPAAALQRLDWLYGHDVTAPHGT